MPTYCHSFTVRESRPLQHGLTSPTLLCLSYPVEATHCQHGNFTNKITRSSRSAFMCPDLGLTSGHHIHDELW